MENKKVVVLTITILFLGLMVAGSTFAFWKWRTSNEDITGVSFTVENGANQLKAILDADTTTIDGISTARSCAGTYAKKVDVTIYYENESVSSAMLSASLNLTSITSNDTANINRAKINYAITTVSGSNCVNLNNVIASGTLSGKANGDNIYTGDLGVGTIPAGTSMTSSTVYLYFWIDSSYTYANYGNSVVNDPMQNMIISVNWTGSITNNSSTLPTYVYAANRNSIAINSTIPNNIPLYSTPQAAMRDVTSIGSGAEMPFCIKYKLVNNVVTEIKIVLIVNDAMVAADSRLHTGVYELEGADEGTAYSDNVSTLNTAFSTACYAASGSTAGKECYSNGLWLGVYENGEINMNLNSEVCCLIWSNNSSRCKHI